MNFHRVFIVTSFALVIGYASAANPVSRALQACGTDESVASIIIVTDTFGGETSWTFDDTCTGEELFSGGGYGSNAEYETNGCVQEGGSYTFEIKDTYGDGICCSWGNGSYTVSVGEETKTGGQFDSSQTETFGPGCNADNCEDSGASYQGKDCAWVANNPNSRCALCSENGNVCAVDYCKETCNSCTVLVPSPTPPPTTQNERKQQEKQVLNVLKDSVGPGTWYNFNEPDHCTWFPEVFCNAAQSIIQLNLYSDNLEGTLPSELGILTNLEVLSMEQNTITGTFPPSWPLTNLKKMWLFDNEISGSIPSEYAVLTSLEQFLLYENDISGTIPSEFGTLTSLEKVHLDGNSITGSIPSELAALVDLKELILSENDVSGPLPSELASCTSLKKLWLDYNKLSNTVPIELAGLASLTDLWLGNNEITGTIPSELSELLLLEQLWLCDNELAGTLPSELALLVNLEVLYTYGNNLTGTVPAEFDAIEGLDIRFQL